MRLLSVVLVALAAVIGSEARAQEAPKPNSSYVQPPAPPPASVPDWVVIYAQGEEKLARDCRIEIAQERDKVNKLNRDLAESKAAKAPAPEPPKK